MGWTQIVLLALAVSSCSCTKVDRLWGVSDTVAIVGRIFEFHIPSDAFSGPIDTYEVTASGRPDLPSWLSFNATSSILRGIPMEKDIGQHYITVVAIPKRDNTNDVHVQSAKDVFSIDVLTSSSSRSVPASSACAPGESSTKLVVALDEDVERATASRRIQLVEEAVDFLKVDKGLLNLFPRDKENSLHLSAILAGPGNAQVLNTPGAILQWQVGCHGEVSSSNQPMLKIVESSSRDGSLASALGSPIIGWHVTIADNPIATSRRIKRQLYDGYATAVPGLVPTKHTKYPVGYWESDNDDEETLGSLEDVDIDDLHPPTRVIPTMASPIFSEAAFHPTHQNHHHRTKTRGRHQHLHQQPYVTASPFHPHHADEYIDGEMRYTHGTPIPTPEIRPTAMTVVEASPTPPLTSRTVTSTSETFEVFVQPSTARASPPILTPTTTRQDTTRTTEVTWMSNQKPIINERVQKLGVVAGKYFEFQVPNDTFYDREDGWTRNLTLTLRLDVGATISPTMWVELDVKRQTIFGLPVKEHINRWDFELTATDSHGENVTEAVEITVEQHRMDRKVTHEFMLVVEHDTSALQTLTQRNVELWRRLRKLYGDADSVDNFESNMTVRSFTTRQFSWTNDSLLSLPGCPHEEIEALYSRLVDERSKVSNQLMQLLKPEFTGSHAPPRVRVKWLGHCKDHATTVPTVVTHTNQRPELRNPIDVINVTEGEPIRFKIPHDTFFDLEQGYTEHLRLELLTGLSAQLRKSDWIRFDSTLNTLVGLPMNGDVGSHNFHLIAYDKEGLHVSDAFVIVVQRRSPSRQHPVEFEVELKYDFDEFESDLRHKLTVLDKLQSLYKDSDTRFINVHGISRGSVIFTWTNNSLPEKPCPKEQIAHLVKYLITSKGAATPALTAAFYPEYNVTGAQVMPMGACQGDMTPTTVHVVPTVVVETEQATGDDDIYVSTIVPAVVIAAMLLIAAIVACILYRKKRKGKMTMEDTRTFVNRGAPIIFANELEEKPDSAKAPMIMKEEKPPLPPPDYNRRASSGSSNGSTPPSSSVDRRHHPRHGPSAPQMDNHGRKSSPYSRSPNRRAPSLDRQVPPEVSAAQQQPLYQPPPPVTANREKGMHWPKHTLTYRMPPPYVPP